MFFYDNDYGCRNCVFEDNSTDGSDRDRYNFDNGSIFEIALYWAVCVVFGIGFTDVTTETRAETTIHTVSLLIGFFFVVYCCSDFAATLGSSIENKYFCYMKDFIMRNIVSTNPLRVC